MCIPLYQFAAKLKPRHAPELAVAPPFGSEQSADAINGFRGAANRDQVGYSSGDAIFPSPPKVKNVPPHGFRVKHLFDPRLTLGHPALPRSHNSLIFIVEFPEDAFCKPF